MAKLVAKQTDVGIWIPSNGPFTIAEIFEQGQSGATGINLPGAGARTIVYFTGTDRGPIPGAVTQAAPGQPTLSIENFLGYYRDKLQKMLEDRSCSYVQVRISNCDEPDHPASWTQMYHFGSLNVGDSTIDNPGSRTYADELVTKSHPLQPTYHVHLVRPALTNLSANAASAAQPLNGVYFIDLPKGCGSCGQAYTGPAQIGFITEDSDGVGGTANVHYTLNGGGTITAYGTDPFAANEDVGFPVARSLNKTQWRLIVARTTTDAGNPPEIAYADLTKGDEGTLSSWTTVNIGSTNGEIVTFVHWPEIQRLYVGVNDDIYLSTDQGATFTKIYTGAGGNNFAGAASDPQGNVYAFGAANVLLLEKSKSSVFAAITGPTGSNANTAIDLAGDGTIWLGNGTSLFRSELAEPSSANHWNSVKNFGSNHAVVQIHVKGGEKAFGGDSQLVDIVVNDGTANEGDAWFTRDGGGFVEEVTNLTNDDYLAAWFSDRDQNVGFIVGGNAASVIHKWSPVSGV